jgi:hypothetical protein
LYYMPLYFEAVIFQNQMRKKMLTFPLLANNADEYSRDAASLVQVIKKMPAGEMKEQLQISYTAALMYIWIVMTVVSGVALIANLFLDEYDMNIAHETEMGLKDKDTEMGSRH